MKKALACIAVLLLALTGFGATKTFTIGSVTPDCGTSTSPAVSVDGASGLTSVSFLLHYDPLVLTHTGCTALPAGWSVDTCSAAAGTVTVAISGPALGGGTTGLVTVNFSVPGTVCDGDSTALNLESVLYNTTESGTAVDGSCVVSCPANVPPGVAANPNPEDNHLCVTPTTSLALQWTAATGATSYDVYFGTTTPPPFHSNVAALTESVSAPAAGTVYYWRVDPVNTCGTTTGSVWSFTTSPAAPAAPANPTPANGATGVALTNVVLDWDDSAGATSYDVWFDGTQVANDIAASTFMVAGPLTPSQTYSWYVIANGDCSQTTTGPIWSFTTESGTPSCGNELVADGGFEGGTPNASWAEGSTNFGTPLCDAASCGTGGGTAGPHSGAWWAWFGGAGTLEDGYLSQTVAFPAGTVRMSFWAWNGSIGSPGDYTRLLIDGTEVWRANYNDPAYTAGYTQVVLVLDAYAGASHLVRFEGHESGSVDTYNFSIDDVSLAECPCPFDLLAPADGSSDQPIAGLVLDWADALGAVTYNLYFGTTNPPPLFQTGLTASAYTTTGLAANTTYYWFVEAVNACGFIGSNQLWSFTTGSTGPPCTYQAYAFDLDAGTLVSFLPATPGTVTTIGSIGADMPFGGDFIGGDYTRIYALDNTAKQLVYYDTTTAAKTVVGAANPAAGHTWTGLTEAPSGTVYASSSDGTVSTLYTINPATGAATTIGNITNGPIVINLAADAAGQLYGLDIAADNLISINPATGAGTVIGPVGFNANYAQGMDFDTDTCTMYMAAFNNTSFQGELRSVDLTTGATTLVGAFPAGHELDGIAFVSCVGPTPPGAFDLLTPANGAIDQPVINLVLDWEDSAGAASYNVYLDTTSPPSTLVGTTTASTFTVVGPLSTSTIYYWRVEAVSGCGITPSTSVFSFTTTATMPPTDLAFDALTLTDDLCPTGGGDNNGSADPGETVSFTVTLVNNGNTATGVSGTLSSTTPGVTIVTGTAAFPDMGPGATGTSLTPFVVDLATTVPCGTNIAFALALTANGGAYATTVNFTAGVGALSVTLLSEGFESTTYPPTGWARYNVDGGGSQWARSTARAHTGVASSAHVYSTAGNQDGFLVTPPLEIPAGATSATLTFWEYTNYAAWYFKHSLLVCTSGCTAPPANWTEIAEFGAPTGAWRQQTVDLTPYIGQTISLAFRYEGNDADDWYIDDVVVTASGTTPICTICYTGTPALAYDSRTFTDACGAGGPGNGDGIADPGENLSVTVTLANTGTATATGVSATLSTATPGVSITVPTANFPNIGVGGTGTSLTPFGVYIAETVPCLTTIDFTLAINSAQGSWAGAFQILVGSPGGGTLLTENFDGVAPPALPAGWVNVPVNWPSGTEPMWRTNAGTVHPSGVPAHSGANLAYFNSYSVSSPKSARLYYSTPFDFSTYSGASVYFWMYHDTGYSSSNDYVMVQVSTDGGTTWTDILPAIPRYNGTTGWMQHDFDLSTYAGQSSVMIGFLGVSGFGNDCHIDDVTLYFSATGGCNVCVCPLPGAFNLLTPTNAATGVPVTNVVLDWEDAAGATSYDFYFGTSPTPPLYAAGIGTSAYTVAGPLTGNTLYYWYVIARNACGLTASATWSFTTTSTTPPCTPVGEVQLVSPPNGATAVAVPVTLVWTADPYADYYEVALGLDPAALALVATTTATSVTVGNLAQGKTYYWRVGAYNECSFSNSDLWSFGTAGEPGPTGANLFIPGVAATTGDRASNWKTDLQIMNTGDQTAAYTLTFIPADTDGTLSPHQKSGTLAAGALVKYDDLVRTVFGLTETAGALHVVGDQRLIAATHTYNDTGNGTYGQFIKGYGTEAFLGAPDARGVLRQGETGYLVSLLSGEAFRTNIGFMEITGQAVTVTVTLYDGQNTPLGSKTYPLLPKGFHQVNNIFQDLGLTGEHPAARAEITLTGGGTILAYASVVDNTTNDAAFTVAQKVLGLPSEAVQTLPAAAHLPGALGTFWRSDVRVLNPSNGILNLTCTFRPVNGAPLTHTVSLLAHHLHTATDAVAEWFAAAGETHGSLEIRTASPLVATSRIYTGTEATYGQGVAAWRSDEGIAATGRGIILGLRSDAAYRTNLGFTETAGAALTLRVRAYDPAGNLLAERTVVLAAREHLQWNDLYAQLGLGGAREGYAVVEGLSGTGRAVVYASVVDNLTNDAITIPAQ